MIERFLNCLLLTGVILTVTAGEQALTLRTAIAKGCENNSALLALEYKIKGAQKRVRQAGAWLNPEIAADVEGIRADEVEVTVTHTIESGKKRNARIQAMAAEAEPLKTEYEALRIELSAAITGTFCELLLLREKKVVIDSLIISATRILDAIQRQYTAGAAMRVDILRAEMAIAGLRNKKSACNRLESKAYLTLKEQLGDTSAHPLQVTGTMRHDVQPPSLEFCVGKLHEHPAQKMFARELSLREAKLQMVQTGWFPDVSVTAGYLRDNARAENKPVVGAGVTVPLFNRNRPEIAAIKEEQRSVEAAASQALMKRKATAERLLLEIGGCDEKLETLRKQLIPSGQSVYDELVSMYDNGRVSFIEVTEAQAELLRYKTDLVDLQLERMLYFVELEQLCGVTFSIIQ